MEPEANNYFGQPEDPERVALVSIAISLKRIADALTYQAGVPLNIYDFLQQISEAYIR